MGPIVSKVISTLSGVALDVYSLSPMIRVQLWMLKILRYLKDPKLWEL